MRIILGVTGSVAGILTPKLAGALIDAGHELQIVSTTPGLYFLPEGVGEELEAKSKSGPIKMPLFRDKNEWPAGGYHKNDPVRHIEFRTWADLLLIAPLSANTLAKMAHGLCDNFLCCIVRAWQIHKPFVIAPAMNTEMWTNLATSEHLQQLRRVYQSMKMIEPIEALLACGDKGVGAMARIETIVETVNSFE